MDELGDLAPRSLGIDGNDAVREALGQLAEPAVDLAPEVTRLALDPVARTARPPGRLAGVENEDEGPVGEEAAHGGEIHLQHRLDAESSPHPLVGERGVHVAIADDVCPTLEGRTHDPLDQLRARSREEGRLGPGGHVFADEKQLADTLAERRPPGLPRGDDVSSFCAEPPAQQLDLSGLA